MLIRRFVLQYYRRQTLSLRPVGRERAVRSAKVGDVKPDLSRLGELAAGLGLRQHLCFIYETQEEQFAAAVPF